MPRSAQPTSEVTLFVNNFWGTPDAGFHILQTRIKSSLNTLVELLEYYHDRINIEKEYTKKLDKLNHKVYLGLNETGSLKQSLDKLQFENDQMCKYNHKFIKSVSQNNYDRMNHFYLVYSKQVNKLETHMTKVLAKRKDAYKNLELAKSKYQDECSQIKNLRLACQTTWGKELEKYEAKLGKLTGSNASAHANYRNAVAKYADLNEIWVRDWSMSLQNLYQLELERIQLCKINCFNFCNNIATLCVDNDQLVDLARSVFAQINPPKDLQDFSDSYGTGNKIYGAPKFVDFMEGYDDSTTTPEVTVAMFETPSALKVLMRSYLTISRTSPTSPPANLSPAQPESPPKIPPLQKELPNPADIKAPDSPTPNRRGGSTDFSQYESGEDNRDVFSVKHQFTNSNGSSNYSNPTTYSSSSERNWASPRRKEKQLSQFQEQINLKSRESIRHNKVLDPPKQPQVPITKDFSIDFIAKALEDLNSGGDGDISQYRRSVRIANREKEDQIRDETFRKTQNIPNSPFRPSLDFVDDSKETAIRYDSINFTSPQYATAKPRPKSMLEPISNTDLMRDDLTGTVVKQSRRMLMKSPSKSYTNLHSMLDDELTPVTRSQYVTKAKAKYTYKPQNHGELYFKKGWYMYVIHKQEDNWFVCELAKNCSDRAGMVGLVPGNYIVEGNNLF